MERDWLLQSKRSSTSVVLQFKQSDWVPRSKRSDWVLQSKRSDWVLQSKRLWLSWGFRPSSLDIFYYIFYYTKLTWYLDYFLLIIHKVSWVWHLNLIAANHGSKNGGLELKENFLIFIWIFHSFELIFRSCVCSVLDPTSSVMSVWCST